MCSLQRGESRPALQLAQTLKDACGGRSADYKTVWGLENPNCLARPLYEWGLAVSQTIATDKAVCPKHGVRLS